MNSPTASAAGPRLELRRLDLAATDRATRDALTSLTRRGAVPETRTRDGARAILEEVRGGGAAAVRRANARYGGGRPSGELVIERAELAGSVDRLAGDVRRALDQSIANVRRFAETQRPTTTRTTIVPGVEIERRWTPLRRVGCYVPGGSAPYPSSLVMTVVPARVAGVGEIVVASPADASGRIDPVLLGAAGMLEVDALLVAGGAQAIGALAFGLADEGLAPVDRIVGPGNAWVTAAKIEVSGLVGIDLPAGPSEGMVLADRTADPFLVAADLVTQAEHGPDSPAILVTTDRDLADAVEAEIERLLPTLDRRAILERALREHGRVIIAADLDSAIEFANAYAPEHLSVDVDDLEAAVVRLDSAGSLFVGRWAPESVGDYATGANHVLPTGGLARSCGPLSVESFGRFSQVQRIDRGGLEALADTVRTLATAEGLTAHRHALEARFRTATVGSAAEVDSPDTASDAADGPVAAAAAGGPVAAPAAASCRSRSHYPPRPPGCRPMSPTPVTYVSPTQPASYSWEATDEEVAARYGVDPATIVRFDLNTSPEPPELAAELLAAGRFDTPLSEYPPSDYRRLVAAAAATYEVEPDELLVGAGADEILDLVGKAFLPPGGVAAVPAPSYAMYRVITEQRGARCVAVPRHGPDKGWAMDLEALRAAARSAAVVWLCSPNNPTGLAEPDGAIERLLADLATDAFVDGREPPMVVLDEAYAEFVGSTLLPLRLAHPNFIVVRTASKAYALAGLRVGFAIARPETIARMAPYRPPGSVSTVSVTIVTEALRRPAAMRANVARVGSERERLAAGLADAGWLVGPSVTNFVLVSFADAQAAAAAADTLLRRGLVPRTFGADHPLAASLRLTVRNPAENDRLIAAARAGAGGSR